MRRRDGVVGVGHDEKTFSFSCARLKIVRKKLRRLNSQMKAANH